MTKIERQWLGVQDVHAYFGGTIGEHKVRELMKSNAIRSVYLGNRIVTRLKSVQEFEEMIFESERAQTIAGIEFAPVKMPIG